MFFYKSCKNHNSETAFQDLGSGKVSCACDNDIQQQCWTELHGIQREGAACKVLPTDKELKSRIYYKTSNTSHKNNNKTKTQTIQPIFGQMN